MGMGMYVDLPDGERAMDKEPQPRMLQVLGMNTNTLSPSFPPPSFLQLTLCNTA